MRNTKKVNEKDIKKIGNREECRKKQQMSKQRRYVYTQIMGGKCNSCGEPYNPHAKRSNLEIDHKFYFPDESPGLGTLLRIIRLKEQGIDPKKQYNLLCHTCHQLVTNIRKNQEKTQICYRIFEKNRLSQRRLEINNIR